jgi:hypothetical protein
VAGSIGTPDSASGAPSGRAVWLAYKDVFGQNVVERWGWEGQPFKQLCERLLSLLVFESCSMLAWTSFDEAWVTVDGPEHAKERRSDQDEKCPVIGQYSDSRSYPAGTKEPYAEKVVICAQKASHSSNRRHRPSTQGSADILTNHNMGNHPAHVSNDAN